MAANHDAERQPLAALERGEIDHAQVARRDEIDASGGAAAQHQPPQPHIGPAGRRIAREVHGGGDEGPAVLAVLEMDRQLGQIDVRAGGDDLLDRRLAAADLDDFGLEPQAPQDFGEKLLRRDPEGASEPRTARQRVADKRVAACVVEQHSLRIGLERLGDRAELGRAGPALQLVGAEPLDERSQPIRLEIDARRRARFRASVTSAFTRVFRRAMRAHFRVAALAARFARQRGGRRGRRCDLLQAHC